MSNSFNFENLTSSHQQIRGRDVLKITAVAYDLIVVLKKCMF